LDEGKSSYRGRSHVPQAGQNEKSAEIIVVIGNEPTQTNQTSEASRWKVERQGQSLLQSHKAKPIFAAAKIAPAKFCYEVAA
jgi:hypothetical protein